MTYITLDTLYAVFFLYNVCMSTDVANTLEYPDLVKTVETALNGEGLNLLINNAGIFVNHNLEEVT